MPGELLFWLYFILKKVLMFSDIILYFYLLTIMSLQDWAPSRSLLIWFNILFKQGHYISKFEFNCFSKIENWRLILIRRSELHKVSLTIQNLVEEIALKFSVLIWFDFTPVSIHVGLFDVEVSFYFYYISRTKYPIGQNCNGLIISAFLY